VILPIETDHLGTARVIQNTSGGGTTWTWNLLANAATGSNAFGEQAASGSDFNLRFPGQYSDGNGLSYNYFRDYEPGTGRYVESDPIGLAGGISSFGYAANSALSFTDYFGLFLTGAGSSPFATALSRNGGGFGYLPSPPKIPKPAGVYYCQRPMIGLPIVPHKYLCTVDHNGKSNCGGQGPEYFPWFSPAPGVSHPEQLVEPGFWQTCNLVDNNDCVRGCIDGKMRGPRPPYSLTPLGTDCWEWPDDAWRNCAIACKSRVPLN
jgi:RHS repeat-associated protein